MFQGDTGFAEQRVTPCLNDTIVSHEYVHLFPGITQLNTNLNNHKYVDIVSITVSICLQYVSEISNKLSLLHPKKVVVCPN